MCTLTLFKCDDGYHVYMNRDERHDRTPEQPPQTLRQKYDVSGPQDPVSAGTWIAFNKNGYWGCMLNGYYEDASQTPVPKKSRGQILVELLNHENPIEQAEKLNASDYLSFRLVIGSLNEHKLFIWTGKEYKESEFLSQHNEKAFFLSSSSWEQGDVTQIRKDMFENWIKNTSEDEYKKTPDFHYSTAPSLEQAPMMLRSYSGTKSITSMHITAHERAMKHELTVENRPAIKTA